MAIVNGITYDSDNNKITVKFVDGDVKGDDFSSAYNFQDIYDTDQDKGWGVFHQPFDNVFISEAAITISGADTYFKDYNILKWSSNLSKKIVFYTRANANVRITNTDGSAFWNNNDTRHDIDLNGGDQEYKNVYINGGGVVWLFEGVYENLKINNLIYGVVIRDDSEIDNIEITNNGRDGIHLMGNPKSINNLRIRNVPTAIRIDHISGDAVFTNIYIDSDIANHFGIYPRYDKLVTISIKNINADIDSYGINSNSIGSILLELQNTFQIYIGNAANAAAILKDKDGNTVTSGTLDADGEWLLTNPVTWVQRYVETDGSQIVENTKTTYEPFSLKVTKTGYQDLTIPNIYSSIYDSEKGKRVGSLEDTVVEGQMVGKNYIDGRIQQQIQEDKIQLQLQEETITFKAYDAS